MPQTDDRRYVYSATCTWHGPIQEVKVHYGLPGCPHCGSPLMEYETRAEWDQQVQKFSVKHPELPRYAEWLESLREKPCRPMQGWNWRADYQQWAAQKPQ